MLLQSARATDQPDEWLGEFFGRVPAGTVATCLWACRRVGELARAWRAVTALPVLHADLSPAADGQALAQGLGRRSRLGRALTRGATFVLEVPSRPEEYLVGQHRRTLRKRRGLAVRAGVRWRAVPNAAERRGLLEVANDKERTHPDRRYRNAAPDNVDLLSLSCWWVAESAQGAPVLLAVVAVDGAWAMLRYFRVLRHDELATSTRFLAMQWIVFELARRRVRFLATDMSPIRIERGLREFQRWVGFRLVRVQVHR